MERPEARAVSISSATPTTAPWLRRPVSGSRRVASSSCRCWLLIRACAARKTRNRMPASSDGGGQRHDHDVATRGVDVGQQRRRIAPHGDHGGWPPSAPTIGRNSWTTWAAGGGTGGLGGLPASSIAALGRPASASTMARQGAPLTSDGGSSLNSTRPSVPRTSMRSIASPSVSTASCDVSSAARLGAGPGSGQTPGAVPRRTARPASGRGPPPPRALRS